MEDGFADLPSELLFAVCDWLDARALALLGATCRRLRGICLDDHNWPLECRFGGGGGMLWHLPRRHDRRREFVCGHMSPSPSLVADPRAVMACLRSESPTSERTRLCVPMQVLDSILLSVPHDFHHPVLWTDLRIATAGQAARLWFTATGGLDMFLPWEWQEPRSAGVHNLDYFGQTLAHVAVRLPSRMQGAGTENAAVNYAVCCAPGVRRMRQAAMVVSRAPFFP